MNYKAGFKTLPGFAEVFLRMGLWTWFCTSVNSSRKEFHNSGENQGRWKVAKWIGSSRAYQLQALSIGAMSCSSDGVELRGQCCSPVFCNDSAPYRSVCWASEWPCDSFIANLWLKNSFKALKDGDSESAASSVLRGRDRFHVLPNYPLGENMTLNEMPKIFLGFL